MKNIWQEKQKAQKVTKVDGGHAESQVSIVNNGSSQDVEISQEGETLVV